jgi:hypothetical protein
MTLDMGVIERTCMVGFQNNKLLETRQLDFGPIIELT